MLSNKQRETRKNLCSNWVLKVNPVSKCQQTLAFKTPHPFQKILLKPPIPDPKQALENLVDPPLVVDSAARLRV